MRFIPIRSGSSGNCTLIESDNTRLLVDAGLTGKVVIKALEDIDIDPATINGILVTHEHSDHIKGVGILSRKFGLPIYANENTWGAMKNEIGKIREDNIRFFESDKEFILGDMCILPFKTPHDSVESVGFSFNQGGNKVSIMTDIGHVSNNLLDAVAGSDLLLIEANHDEEVLKVGSYPYALKRRILSDHGHLSNYNCGIALSKLYKTGVKNAILGHLSHENNYEPLAYETVRSVLRQNDIPDCDFNVMVAHRDALTGIFVV